MASEGAQFWSNRQKELTPLLQGIPLDKEKLSEHEQELVNAINSRVLEEMLSSVQTLIALKGDIER